MIFYWLLSAVFLVIPEFDLYSIVAEPTGLTEFLKHVTYYVPVAPMLMNIVIFIGVFVGCCVIRIIIDLL